MKFTQLTEKLSYPAKFKARLSTYHVDMIEYFISHFKNTRNYKNDTIKYLNTVSCMVISGDTIPDKLDNKNSIESISLIDENTCKDILGNLYIDFKFVEWDVEEVPDTGTITSDIQEKSEEISTFTSVTSEITEKHISTTEDLSLKPPVIPLLDFSKPWFNAEINGEIYTIYTSLPIIPEVQRDISVTTDVKLFTRSDFLNLFPNNFVKTRNALMYEKVNNLDFDEKLGCILPILDFSKEQLIDNIVRYPHFYRIKRKIDGTFTNFYSKIEVNGKLYNTLEIWDSLPDTEYIPKKTEFIKEYVIRRYLLERDVLKIEHKFPMFGSLQAFVTLFDTASAYKKWGYTDSENLAKKCVESRIAYLQSRNPMLRKVYESE